MWRTVLVATASVVMVGCGSGPDDPKTQAQQAPPDTADTALLESTQATLDRAKAVQDTVDDRAAKLDAQTREALGEPGAREADPNEDPDAAAKDE
jgi:hypothetical protein